MSVTVLYNEIYHLVWYFNEINHATGSTFPTSSPLWILVLDCLPQLLDAVKTYPTTNNCWSCGGWMTHSQASYFHLYSTKGSKNNWHLHFLWSRVGHDFLKCIPGGKRCLSAIRPWRNVVWQLLLKNQSCVQLHEEEFFLSIAERAISHWVLVRFFTP